jgi:hypothetical protein
MIRFAAAAMATLLACGMGSAAEPPLEIALTAGQESRVEVRGFSEGELARLKQADLAAERYRPLLEVYVAPASSESDELADDAVPLFGGVRLAGDALRFEPRFPFQPGVAYRAVVRRGVLAADSAPRGEAVSRVFKLPEPKLSPSTEISAVYPSGDVLPENQLKLYLHFSAPMSRGRVYRHIHLLRDDGSEVDLPFLELDEELWDAAGKRLTVFFDPGRIKRGLKPREEVGPVLEEGKTYTLVIDKAWQDARGQPLVRDFRRTFKSAAPDDVQPKPQRWKLAAPAAGTREPLAVALEEPLDHAMLHRVLAVRAADGEFIAGEASVDRGETRWRFTPEAAWTAGRYELVVAAALEDRAGNSIARPFEVDLFEKVEPISRATVSVPFEIAAP